MTIYVTIAIHQGVVHEVRAFLSEESADAAEQAWLAKTGIHHDQHRQAKANDGTEFLLFGVDANP